MADKNPLSNDKKLKQLLKDVDSIKSEAVFQTWKGSFLKSYVNYLDPDGVANARDADGRLITKLQMLAKVAVDKVTPLTQDGNISTDQVTAEGWNAINKLLDGMSTVDKEISKFCPKTSRDETAVGYDKFELGAVLIKDGFHAYDIMLTTREFIREMREGPLDGILDKNHKKIMDFYDRSIQTFIDVMADLGLMKLMKQCVQVYKSKPRPPPRIEPADPADPLDLNDGTSSSNKGKGPDGTWKSSGGGGPNDSGAKSRPKGKAAAQPADDSSSSSDSDSEEEEDDDDDENDGDGGDEEKMMYFDPKTGTIGYMMRKEVADRSELVIRSDDKGKEINQGVVDSTDERNELVWYLKKLEKKKPEPEGWLEKIKREKAEKAAAGKGGTTGTAKKAQSKAPGKKTCPAAKGAKEGTNWGSNPLEAGSTGGTGKTPLRKKKSNDSVVSTASTKSGVSTASTGKTPLGRKKSSDSVLSTASTKSIVSRDSTASSSKGKRGVGRTPVVRKKSSDSVLSTSSTKSAGSRDSIGSAPRKKRVATKPSATGWSSMTSAQ